MACCGQTAAQALAAGLRVMDERIGQQTHVKIVYTGADVQTRAYVTGGNVFQFGNNERRRVNLVPARAVGFFLDATSPHYGKFVLFDEALHNPDGLAMAPLLPEPDPNLAAPKGKKARPELAEGKEQGNDYACSRS